MQKFLCFLNIPNVSPLLVHDRDVYSQIGLTDYMAWTKIDITSRNKVDIENHYLCFFNAATEEKLR